MIQHDTGDWNAGELNYDNDFWRFSLAVYGADSVAEECLALQDACGIDVNILLFCAWLGTQSVVLKRTDIEAASRVVAAWHESVVRPLRVIRQQTKTLFRDTEFRASIKDIEIRAEQIEQAVLFAFSHNFKPTRASDSVARNVQQYIEMRSRAVPTPDANTSAIHLIDAARRLAS